MNAQVPCEGFRWANFPCLVNPFHEGIADVLDLGSNNQIIDVKDKDDDLTREPEMIKAYRDTWELGIHSYLTYMRDRLRVSLKLLSDSGSIFVQISDENMHLVRCLMDEVFGVNNFCRIITVRKTAGFGSKLIPVTNDYLLWYAKDIDQVKFNQLYYKKTSIEDDSSSIG